MPLTGTEHNTQTHTDLGRWQLTREIAEHIPRSSPSEGSALPRYLTLSRAEGPCGIDFSVSGPPPGWFQGLGPLSRKQKHVLFSTVTRPLHVRYTSVTRPLHVRYAAPQAKFCGLDTSKVPISLKFEGESCALAHPMESDIAMHTCLGSTIMDRVIHYLLPSVTRPLRPLHPLLH